MCNNILLSLRFLIALLFIVSGFEKVISPSENFLYVLQAYRFFPDGIDRLAAILFPWLELGIGVFLALGLWLRWVLIALAGMSGALVIVVLQAIIRALPIDNCGCFGDLVHLPLRGVIILDLTILASALFCYRNIAAVSRFSLDDHYRATAS